MIVAFSIIIAIIALFIFRRFFGRIFWVCLFAWICSPIFLVAFVAIVGQAAIDNAVLVFFGWPVVFYVIIVALRIMWKLILCDTIGLFSPTTYYRIFTWRWAP